VRSQEQAADLARGVEAAVGATQIGVKQYNTGITTFNTVFQLETAQMQQQEQLALSQGNTALNLISVYRALGGGWEFRLQQNGGNPPPLASVPQPAAASVTK
jgi:outer membrane protein TolC